MDQREGGAIGLQDAVSGLAGGIEVADDFHSGRVPEDRRLNTS